MNIGKKIIEIRKKYNLSQEELAKMFFVTRQTISSWECGKSYPDIETIIKISNKFNVSLDKLLKEDEEMVKKIDKKVRLNKYLIITLIILIIISIPIGIYSYKERVKLKANNVITTIPDNYTVIDFSLDNITFDSKINTHDYIDLYVNNYDSNNPLYKGIEVLLLRNELMDSVNNIKDAKHMIIAVPNEEFSFLTMLKSILENTRVEIKKSNDKTIMTNNELKNKIMNEFYIFPES